MPRKNPVKDSKDKAKIHLDARIASYEQTIRTPKGTRGFHKPGSQQIKW
jgi:hypothetical protein